MSPVSPHPPRELANTAFEDGKVASLSWPCSVLSAVSGARCRQLEFTQRVHRCAGRVGIQRAARWATCLEIAFTSELLRL